MTPFACPRILDASPGRTAMALGLVVATAPARADTGETFTAGLEPQVAVTAVGDTVSLVFTAGASATGFNGYAVEVTYDPTLLELVQVDEGDLMVDSCADRFVDVAETDSTVTYSHVLLCTGLAIDGPGMLSTYHFRALAEGRTDLRITSDPDCTFVEAGLCVGSQHPERPRDVVLHGAEVIVTDGVVATDPPAPPVSPPRVRLLPNPSRGGGTFDIALGDATEGLLEVFDASGRRRLQRRVATGMSGWDGRDARGALLPSGRYLLRLTVDGRATTTPFTLIR